MRYPIEMKRARTPAKGARATETGTKEQSAQPGGRNDAHAGKPGESRSDRRPAGLPTAKGALLLAVPLAVLLTTIVIVQAGLSLWWAIPLYGLIGAIFALVLLLL